MIKIFMGEGVVDGQGEQWKMFEVGWWGWGSLKPLSKNILKYWWVKAKVVRRGRGFWRCHHTYKKFNHTPSIMLPLQTFLEQRSNKFSKNDCINPYLSDFICMAKLWLKRNQLMARPTFSLIPVKVEKDWQKLDFDPQNKEWRNYSGLVMTLSILLWFCIEFVTYFHNTNFCFSWPSDIWNKEGVESTRYLRDVLDPLPFRVKNHKYEKLQPAFEVIFLLLTLGL